MPKNNTVIGEEGLLFFGKISASISHELKNALSIINEGAGLLEDLAALSAKGLPFDPERLPPLGEKIRRQVQRADRIIKRMNRFAHTVDTRTGAVELDQMLRQVCALAERFAAMRNVMLDVEKPNEPVTVVSDPFLLQNVVWICLDFAMQSVAPGERLGLQAEKAAIGASIRIQAASGLSRPALDRFLPADRLCALGEGLKADVTLDEKNQVLGITLPHDIGAYIK